VLSTYSYSLWDDAQKNRTRAMAAAMILALIVTLIGLGGSCGRPSILTRRWCAGMNSSGHAPKSSGFIAAARGLVP